MTAAYPPNDEPTSADRPDWSGFLDFIEAGRTVLENPTQLAIAQLNRQRLIDALPDWDFTDEWQLHEVIHTEVTAKPSGWEACILSLIPLIPEDVR